MSTKRFVGQLYKYSEKLTYCLILRHNKVALVRVGAPKYYWAQWVSVRDTTDISKDEWKKITNHSERFKLMNPDERAQPFRRTIKAINVRDILNRIIKLQNMLRPEKNSKEKARLVDEQAALKLTLRLFPTITAETRN